MTWLKVDSTTARAHPLYGFGGWLIAVSTANVLTLLLALAWNVSLLSTAPVNQAKYAIVNSLVPWISSANDIAISVACVLAVILLICWFAKVRAYLWLWLATQGYNKLLPLVLAYVIGFAIDEKIPGSFGKAQQGMFNTFAVELLETLAWDAPFFLYMFFSRRYRVTFEHKIRKTDPMLNMPSGTKVPAHRPAPY